LIIDYRNTPTEEVPQERKRQTKLLNLFLALVAIEPEDLRDAKTATITEEFRKHYKDVVDLGYLFFFLLLSINLHPYQQQLQQQGRQPNSFSRY